jgi:threonine/homoserine/homoserine lactone efflux protein
MNYLFLIASGVVIGLMVAAPIGPVNLICLRRTLAFGPVVGFVSGLGAALGDGLFATITAFGLTVVANWIEGYSAFLQIVGGCLLFGFGIHTYLADPLQGRDVSRVPERDQGGSSLLRTFASTFALTMANPATIFGFAALFGGLRVIAPSTTDASYVDSGFIVLGVMSGSALWWFTLTTIVGLFHARIDSRAMKVFNRVCGIVVCLFGLVVLGHVAFRNFLLF